MPPAPILSLLPSSSGERPPQHLWGGEATVALCFFDSTSETCRRQPPEWRHLLLHSTPKHFGKMPSSTSSPPPPTPQAGIWGNQIQPDPLHGSKQSLKPPLWSSGTCITTLKKGRPTLDPGGRSGAAQVMTTLPRRRRFEADAPAPPALRCSTVSPASRPSPATTCSAVSQEL